MVAFANLFKCVYVFLLPFVNSGLIWTCLGKERDKEGWGGGGAWGGMLVCSLDTNNKQKDKRKEKDRYINLSKQA